MKTIVFVCIGNTCRSPMAEGIFRVLLRENGIEDVECTSCGLYADVRSQATGKAVRAAKTYGADISGHRSRLLTRDLLKRGDLFVCMTKAYAQDVIKSYHVREDKVLALNICDPYGGNEEDYAQCAAEIRSALVDNLKEICKGGIDP